MIGRCYQPKRKNYKQYGAKGIAVAGEWHEFAAFAADMLPAWKRFVELWGVNPHLSRREHKGWYKINNCVWEHPEDNRKCQGKSATGLRATLNTRRIVSPLDHITHGWDYLSLQEPFNERSC